MLAMLKWLLLLIFTLLLAGFSVVNRHLITVSFYPLPYEVELPVYLLILVMFFAGFALAWMLGRIQAIRQSGRLYKAKRRSDALEEEVSRLKHQPNLANE